MNSPITAIPATDKSVQKRLVELVGTKNLRT